MSVMQQLILSSHVAEHQGTTTTRRETRIWSETETDSTGRQDAGSERSGSDVRPNDGKVSRVSQHQSSVVLQSGQKDSGIISKGTTGTVLIHVFNHCSWLLIDTFSIPVSSQYISADSGGFWRWDWDRIDASIQLPGPGWRRGGSMRRPFSDNTEHESHVSGSKIPAGVCVGPESIHDDCRMWFILLPARHIFSAHLLSLIRTFNATVFSSIRYSLLCLAVWEDWLNQWVADASIMVRLTARLPFSVLRSWQSTSLPTGDFCYGTRSYTLFHFGRRTGPVSGMEVDERKCERFPSPAAETIRRNHRICGPNHCSCKRRAGRETPTSGFSEFGCAIRWGTVQIHKWSLHSAGHGDGQYLSLRTTVSTVAATEKQRWTHCDFWWDADSSQCICFGVNADPVTQS